MKKKSVITTGVCFAIDTAVLSNNKIYMIYIGNCHRQWEAAQTYYSNRQYKKAKEALVKIKSESSEEQPVAPLLFT